MAKRLLTKRELEELKKKEEEEAAAQVFEQFVATFQEEPSKISKVWVKAGTYDAGQRKEDTQEKGKLYRPVSKIPELADTHSVRQHIKDERADQKSKKKEKEKKKSNLELFKEELKAAQMEREERHRIKNVLNVSTGSKTSRFEPTSPAAAGKLSSAIQILADEKTGSFDSGDPNTTNLYLGNINPKITEQQLMEIFGKYGPLASVKIMWPRSEEEKARNRNCGFVAFMARKDAERAMKKLLGKDIMGFEMKMGWGKALPIPSRPIYIPPALLKNTLPPPPTGLPFNALPEEADVDKIPAAQREGQDEFHQILSRAVVKVVIPTERNLLCLIHRMVEFVVREGPMFEAMLMNREIENPQFRFLFENRSPAHVYYRWKLYSVLQGDAVNQWRTEDFRMFKGGSVWRPPPVNPFAQGMPDDLFSDDEADEEDRRRSLSKSQKKRLEQMLRELTPERSKIIDAMIFCIEHAEAAEEISEFITESLNSSKTPLIKKLGRFYLVIDILYNCSAKAVNASNYRTGFLSRLTEIVRYMNQAYERIESRLKAEAFKQRVMLCFRALEDWAMYPQDFLIQLQNIFLGLVTDAQQNSGPKEDVDGVPLEDSELDGAPLSDSEDLDGVPLDGAALLRGASKLQSVTSRPSVSSSGAQAKKKRSVDDDDIDGVPLSKGNSDKSATTPKITSKWEISEEMTAGSKWESDDIFSDTRKSRPDRDDIYHTDPETSQAASSYQDDDIDGAPLDETSQDTSQRSSDSKELDSDRREKLRKIELEVVRYQDDLEAGLRNRVPYMTLAEQVEKYRQELLRSISNHDSKDREPESSRPRRDSERESRSHGEREKERDRERHRERERGRSRRSSRSRSRSRSSSRRRRSRSRSTSPRRSRRSRSGSRSRSPSRKSKNSKKSRH